MLVWILTLIERWKTNWSCIKFMVYCLKWWHITERWLKWIMIRKLKYLLEAISLHETEIYFPKIQALPHHKKSLSDKLIFWNFMKQSVKTSADYYIIYLFVNFPKQAVKLHCSTLCLFEVQQWWTDWIIMPKTLLLQ